MFFGINFILIGKCYLNLLIKYVNNIVKLIEIFVFKVFYMDKSFFGIV